MTQLVQSIPSSNLAPPVIRSLTLADSGDLPLRGAGPFTVSVSLDTSDTENPIPMFSTSEHPTPCNNITWAPGPDGKANGLTNILFVFVENQGYKVSYLVSNAGNLLTMFSHNNATGSCCVVPPSTQKFHFTVYFTGPSDSTGVIVLMKDHHDPYIQVTPP